MFIDYKFVVENACIRPRSKSSTQQLNLALSPNKSLFPRAVSTFLLSPRSYCSTVRTHSSPTWSMWDIPYPYLPRWYLCYSHLHVPHSLWYSGGSLHCGVSLCALHMLLPLTPANLDPGFIHAQRHIGSGLSGASGRCLKSSVTYPTVHKLMAGTGLLDQRLICGTRSYLLYIMYVIPISH